jgi:nicotinate-nucleotide adenylyltransferase
LKKIYKKNNTRIGILGGTFDPPHAGHLHISKIAIKKLNLDKLIWVITKQNPFKKQSSLSIGERIKLSKQKTKKQKKIFIRYIETKIKSKNTFDLLNYLKKKNKKNILFFLIGADNLIKFHKWKKWKKIPDLAKIVVFARSNYISKALSSIASKSLKKKDWMYINSKKINISSSLIRKF